MTFLTLTDVETKVCGTVVVFTFLTVLMDTDVRVSNFVTVLGFFCTVDVMKTVSDSVAVTVSVS